MVSSGSSCTFSSCCWMCHTDPASTLEPCAISKVQSCCWDNSYSPAVCCFSSLHPFPNSPLLHTVYCWKAFCELFVISSGKIIQINVTFLIKLSWPYWFYQHYSLKVLRRNGRTTYSTPIGPIRPIRKMNTFKTKIYVQIILFYMLFNNWKWDKNWLCGQMLNCRLTNIFISEI